MALDDDLRRVDQREQRRAQGVHANALLLVGDARRASDVGVEHGVDQRLDAPCGSDDVAVALGALFGFQHEIRVVEDACVTPQHVDRRLQACRRWT